MVELADTGDLKSPDRKVVQVQVLLRAPICGDDGIGIRTALRQQVLGVRLPFSVPICSRGGMAYTQE